MATRGLTEREVQVLALVAQGYTDVRVGRELNLSHKTIKMHLRNLRDKLGADNRTHAVQRAYELGIFPIVEPEAEAS